MWRKAPGSVFSGTPPVQGVELTGLSVPHSSPFPFSSSSFSPPFFLLCLRYLKHTLDQYVESDYTLLYLHHGLSSDNKPSLSWLRDAYREFDRKCVGIPG